MVYIVLQHTAELLYIHPQGLGAS